MKTTEIKIGTRGSKLALWQANWVKSNIEKMHPGIEVSLSIIKTKGDKILDVPLAKVGGKGLFVKEIEAALINKEIDLAVHSMKDMPSDIPQGLCIGAVPIRENPKDVLISRDGSGLMALREGAVVGTSSLRRSSQILKIRPDITIVSLRGNLDTRLKKLKSEGLDAIVLAAAGVKRLGLEEKISEFIDEDIMLPAVGQGALCIETRIDDPVTDAILKSMDDPDTRSVVMGERAFLNRLEGGCQVPIAGHGKLDQNEFSITGMVADIDGSNMLKETLVGSRDRSVETGIALAEKLLSLGAGNILKKIGIDAEN